MKDVSVMFGETTSLVLMGALLLYHLTCVHYFEPKMIFVVKIHNVVFLRWPIQPMSIGKGRCNLGLGAHLC